MKESQQQLGEGSWPPVSLPRNAATSLTARCGGWWGENQGGPGTGVGGCRVVI